MTITTHALVDTDGLPIALNLTNGQARGGRRADMLDTLGDGDVFLADRPDDSDALPIEMTARDAWGNIKPVSNREKRPGLCAFLYRYHDLVERFVSKLKHVRAVATRHNKRDDNFLTSVQLASIRVWLRHNESVAERGGAGGASAFVSASRSRAWTLRRRRFRRSASASRSARVGLGLIMAAAMAGGRASRNPEVDAARCFLHSRASPPPAPPGDAWAAVAQW